jgi:uncharacterized protein
MKKTTQILIGFILAFSISNAIAQDCMPTKPQGLVLDKVGILDQTQLQTLDQKLIAYEQKTSTQILVVIIDDMCGMDKAMYATELGQKWKVGQDGKDNGIVMLIKPTGGKGQRQTFIAVGYGLEGVIPDAIAKRIVEAELLPKFKANDIYGGINGGIDVIMKLSAGEFTADEYKKKTDGSPLLIFLLLGIVILIIIGSRFSAARSYANTNHTSIWVALMLMSAASSSHSGSYGNFSSGGGGFGGGGSSFGGFGGGSFGGGGAGGSW